MIEVDLRQLPPSGKILEGTSDTDVFELAATDPVQPGGPLIYQLKVTRSGDSALLEGSISATFSLQCGRCLERYLHSVQLPEYTAEIALENREIIDLTEGLREDILLDLPGYPRCENGNVHPRECPATGEFTIRASGGSLKNEKESSEAPDEKNVWGALDDIDLKP